VAEENTEQTKNYVSQTPTMKLKEFNRDLETTERSFQGLQVFRHRKYGKPELVVTSNCDYCGRRCLVPLRKYRSKERIFCDPTCSGKFYSGDHSGKSNPAYRGKIDYVSKIKSKGSCIRCGEENEALLCFHHRNPENKVEAVSRMAVSAEYDLHDIKQEIEKCDIVCNSCHNTIHGS
jgi:hypothetical protein